MIRTHPDRSLIALGVRQPWVELILRGVKTIEVRTVTTNVRGTIYLYSSKVPSMLDQARSATDKHRLDLDDLIYGRLVGKVDIIDCRRLTAKDLPATGLNEPLQGRHYAWCLANPVRLDEPLEPRFLPYGIWFYPFQRRSEPHARRRKR